jgi:hypothetical protein
VPDVATILVAKAYKRRCPNSDRSRLNMTNEIGCFHDNLKEDTALENSVVISFSEGYTTFKEQDN